MQHLFIGILIIISCIYRFAEGVSSPEAGKSPIIGNRGNESTASPKSPSSPAAAAAAATATAPLSPASTDNWPTPSEEDIDRLVAMHQNRSSLSSLGVSIINFLSRMEEGEELVKEII